MNQTLKRQTYEKAGRRAETLACWYLRLKGYQILNRRFKTKLGEIDIVARKSNTVIMVEVKQRQTREDCEASLHEGTWRRLHNAANVFLSKSKTVRGHAVRYDALFVIGRFKIIHRPDIWRP